MTSKRNCTNKRVTSSSDSTGTKASRFSFHDDGGDTFSLFLPKLKKISSLFLFLSFFFFLPSSKFKTLSFFEDFVMRLIREMLCGAADDDDEASSEDEEGGVVDVAAAVAGVRRSEAGGRRETQGGGLGSGELIGQALEKPLKKNLRDGAEWILLRSQSQIFCARRSRGFESFSSFFFQNVSILNQGYFSS